MEVIFYSYVLPSDLGMKARGENPQENPQKWLYRCLSIKYCIVLNFLSFLCKKALLQLGKINVMQLPL